MSLEYMPSRVNYEETILTVDEFGEEIEVPVSKIPELQKNPYSWGDAMIVEFDKGEDDA